MKDTFADVVFLQRKDGVWKLTHEVLDAAKRENMIERLDMLRVRSSDEAEKLADEWRAWSEVSDRRMHEEAYRMGTELLGKEFVAEEMERDYQRQKSLRSYIAQRRDAGTYPNTFFEVMEIYDVEFIDPPIAFDVTKEPPDPNFNSLLDAIQTSFYLSTLQLQRGSLAGAKLIEEFDWQMQSLDELEVKSGLPEYLPRLIPRSRFRLAGLGLVQIRVRIPVLYQGKDYQVVIFTMVETDSSAAYRAPIAVDGPKYIGAGYTYFMRDGSRWVPSQDMGGYPGLGRVMDWKRTGAFYSRRHKIWVYRKDRALEMLKTEEGWPAYMRRLYSPEECRSIKDARAAGVWRDL